MAEAAFRDPSFVHLRMHSEYSIVDGIVRIDAAVAAAAADAQPALALTDLSNLFGLVRFYKAARGGGPQADRRMRRVGAAREVGSAPTSSRALLLARNRGGYLALCHLLSRAYLENASHGRAELRFDWFDDVEHVGPDRAVGCAGRRRRARARGRASRAGARARASLGRALPRRVLRRAATLRTAGRRELHRRGDVARRRARAAGRRDASGAVPDARGVRRARGAHVHRRRRDAREPAPAAALHGRAVPEDAAARWPRCSPTSRRRSSTRSRSRSAATCDSSSAGRGCRCSRRRPADRSTSTCGSRPQARSRATAARAVSRRGAPRGRASALREPASRSRPRPSRRWASPATS